MDSYDEETIDRTEVELNLAANKEGSDYVSAATLI